MHHMLSCKPTFICISIKTVMLQGMSVMPHMVSCKLILMCVSVDLFFVQRPINGM